MSIDFPTGEPVDDDPAPGSVLDIPPQKLKVAGKPYTFRCPKLAVWAEFAVPAASRVTQQGRSQAAVGGMIMFLHAALAPEDSEELHQRKYDPADPLDVPDYSRAFTALIAAWSDPVRALAEAAGMRLDLEEQEPVPRPGRKAAVAKAPPRPIAAAPRKARR